METRPRTRGKHVTIAVYIWWSVLSYCKVLGPLPCGSLYRGVEPVGDMWRARPPPPTTLMVPLGTSMLHTLGTYAKDIWPKPA